MQPMNFRRAEVAMKTDAQVQADVMKTLNWDPSVTHEHIGVSVLDGIVTLSGTVPSYMEKSAAVRAAQRVSSVKAVVEKIEVNLPGHFTRTDQDIASAILNQFLWDVQVPDSRLKVAVKDGWVTLTGEVDWQYQRDAAERCVRGLTGVKGISDEIKIKVKAIKPEEIRRKIEEALKRAAEREAQRISVQVDGTKVILSGDVHSISEAEDARWAAWSAPGVDRVENKLTVASTF